MYQVKILLTDGKGKPTKQHIFQSISKTNADEIFKNITKEMYKSFDNSESEVNWIFPDKSPTE